MKMVFGACRFSLAPMVLSIGLAVFASPHAQALTKEEPVLRDEAMAGAINYFERLSGVEIGADDRAWLKQQWTDDFSRTPHEVDQQLDNLLVQLELLQRDGDPIQLARSRGEMIDSAYCAAEQSGDPDLHRLRAILAPDEVILAADCIFGMVMTRFDLDALSASHALMASIVGLGMDVDEDRASLARFIKDEFDNSEPETKALMADGELRYALAERFWQRLHGDPRQAELTSTFREQAAGDLRGSARNLERLALQELASIDYVVEASGLRLTNADLDEYMQVLQAIAGEPISLGDRVWLRDMAIKEFLSDPEKVSGWVESYKQANKNHLRERDPARRRAMVAAWAIGSYCHLAKGSDPDDGQALEIIFEANPVISSDCDAKTLKRHYDIIVAEADGFTWSEGDLATTGNWLAFILGRQPTMEEASFDRDYVIQKFNRDPAKMMDIANNMREIFAKQEKQDLVFLWEEERRKLVGSFYCHFKHSDDREQTYVDMFSIKDEIIHEDCEKQFISTRADIDAVVGSMDFLAMLAGIPPFTIDERAELHLAWTGQDMSYGLINRVALSQWWSVIDVVTKKDAISRLQSGGFIHAGDIDAKIGEWLNHAKLNVVLLEAKRNQCALMAVISQGYTNLYAASSGPDRMRPYGMLGYELTHLVPMNNMFSAFCS